MRNIFVSGSIHEKESIRAVYSILENLGYAITHDWTRTDDIGDKLLHREEAGRRAAKDIQGVIDSDIYILMSDNRHSGKGMYAELGAAIALNALHAKPEIYVVGPLNHLSVFYLHPAVQLVETVDEIAALLSPIDA